MAKQQKVHSEQQDVDNGLAMGGVRESFVIMPISDPEGYPAQHFRHVFDDMISPACEKAGYAAIRADQVKATNLIHVDMLKRLVKAPMAVCDLSTRNPNVLFELGIRQAFDKPVVLIQEKGTPKIFDISPIRYLEYSKEMRYHEVVAFQQLLSEAIKETADAASDEDSVNSIVRLMALTSAATMPDVSGKTGRLEMELLHAELREVRQLLGGITNVALAGGRMSAFAMEYARLCDRIDRLSNGMQGVHPNARMKMIDELQRDIHSALEFVESPDDHRLLMRLMERSDHAFQLTPTR